MTNTKERTKRIFVEGAISPERIATSIAHHQVKTAIGAHDIFLGQVRADEVDGRTVVAIEFTAHEELAGEEMHNIREETFARFGITCMHVYHSLGRVEVGQLCFFVFTSAPHREEAFAACRHVVEQVKARLPIFGRELFADGGHRWKENRPTKVTGDM